MNDAESPTLEHWRWERDAQGLAWLSFDRRGASANTFSRAALEELDTALGTIAAQAPSGLVIRSAKDNFIAGADIEAFTGFTDVGAALAFVRLGWDVLEHLARLPFPTTALVNGFCMGGGLELALACRYRVALDDPKTRFALPEVMLGIMPAWHGMQWLPKRIGAPAALDMMLSGRSLDARRAKRVGLVDEAVPLRIFENTARVLTLEAPRPRRLPLAQRALLAAPLRRLVARRAAKQLAQRARREHYPAPYAILETWERHDGDPFAAAQDADASLGMLFEHPTTRNLIRVFFLQERLKSLGKGAGFAARHVHVVGAGVMGGDIAALCALRGLSVTLQDTSPERIAPALKRAARLFERHLRDARRVRDALDRLTPDVAGNGVARADLVIEAIYENLQAKRELLAAIERRARPEALLASNTSSLRLADIAAQLADPSRLVGMHFFNPVPRMMLVEVVAHEACVPARAAQAAAFVRRIDKLPLPVKDSPGFLVNRVLGPYLQNAFRMLDEGAKPETLDAAMLDFGMPMGPVELADTVGLDICLAAGKALGRKEGDGAEPEAPRILLEKIALGQLGKKSGRGIYRYDARGKAEKAEAGAYDERLIEALIGPYLAEAQAALADGVVADADLVDAGLVFGSGFAPFRGGPLHYLVHKR